MDAFVSLRNVTCRFGPVVAVDAANLSVARGEIVALLGPSGCGKTTLLRLIGGLETPESGEIVLDGRTLNSGGTFMAPEKRGVAMVFQDFALFPHMNVTRNIAFGLPRGANKKSRVNELLDLVGLGGLGGRYPHELSGGQQQRVALARALAPEPRLMLLDEPFSNLDPTVRQRVRDEVRQLLRTVGITAIFVTHDQDEALSLADRVAVMIAGRVLRIGTPAEIYREPGLIEVAAFVGEPNFLSATIRDGVADTELGAVPTLGMEAGAVKVMVRAEDVVSCADGVAAEVIDVAYFGHDFVVTFRLPSGMQVRARWHGSRPPSIGEQLTVAARGPAQAFPVD